MDVCIWAIYFNFYTTASLFPQQWLDRNPRTFWKCAQKYPQGSDYKLRLFYFQLCIYTMCKVEQCSPSLRMSNKHALHKLLVRILVFIIQCCSTYPLIPLNAEPSAKSMNLVPAFKKYLENFQSLREFRWKPSLGFLLGTESCVRLVWVAVKLNAACHLIIGTVEFCHCRWHT